MYYVLVYIVANMAVFTVISTVEQNNGGMTTHTGGQTPCVLVVNDKGITTSRKNESGFMCQ